MYLLKMNINGQVTIPTELRKKLHCHAGDYFQIQIENNVIKLVLAKIISPAQSWFWTKEWQEKEKEAEGDLKAGRYKKFKSTKEAIKHLGDLTK